MANQSQHGKSQLGTEEAGVDIINSLSKGLEQSVILVKILIDLINVAILTTANFIKS